MSKVYKPIVIPACPHAPQPPAAPDTPEAYEVHLGLLEHYSGSFWKTLRAKKLIGLPKKDMEVFGIFKNWMYTKILYYQLETDHQIPLTFSRILDCYVFGNTYHIPEFCNAAINVLLQKGMQSKGIPLAVIEFAYKHTEPGDLLRKFLVDAVACSNFERSDDYDDYNCIPKDYLKEVILESVSQNCAPGKRLSTPAWYNEAKDNVCQYHDHIIPAYGDDPNTDDSFDRIE